MKKAVSLVIIFSIILILSVSIVSVGWWSNFFGKITGRITREAVIESNNWCNGADINKDGKVNGVDLAALGRAWNPGGVPPCEEPDWCNGADINKDGKVNGVDFATLGKAWNQGGVPACVSQRPPEEIAVRALLEYSGAESGFDSLKTLTEEQITALNSSLNLLEEKNFVVFNKEIVVLENSLCNNADINKDGNVSFADYKILEADYTGPQEDLPLLVKGDTDLDGDVDGVDRTSLVLSWSPGPSGKTWQEGDFDGDGDVDGVDQAALGLNWNPGGYYNCNFNGEYLGTGIEGDIDRDGDVDCTDYEIFKDNFGKTDCLFEPVQVYAEGDLVYLEIFDNTTSKGRILLEDLGVLDDLEDCSKYDVGGDEEEWQNYIYCTIENYAKENSEILITQDENLINNIKVYLGNLFGNFESNFEIENAHNYLKIIPLNEEIGVLFLAEPGWYNKEYILNYSIQVAPELIFDKEDTSSFIVIGEGVIEPIITYTFLKIIEESGSSPITGSVIADSSDFSCNYDSQTGDYRIPCNNQIYFLEGYYGQPFDNFIRLFKAERIKPFKKLEPLGYEFKRENIFYLEKNNIKLVEELLNNPAQILVTAFHGDAGGGTAAWVLTDKGVYKNIKNKLSNLLLSPHSFGYRCGKNEYCFLIDVPQENVPKKALHIGYQCFGQDSKIKDAYASYLSVGIVGAAGGEDVKLLARYLQGIGPRKNYYTRYPPKYTEYLGNPIKNNVFVHNVMDFGGPEADWNPITMFMGLVFGFTPNVLKMKCYSPQGGLFEIRIPCGNKGDVYQKPVHLFPFVEDFFGLGKGFTVTFSDNVTEPTNVKFIGESGEIDVIKITGEEDDTEFDYEISFPPATGIVSKNKWEEMSNEEKANVRIGEIVISGSRAAIEKNQVEMMGNPAAYITYKNKTHKQPFWLYDDYFWNYNARAIGKNINEFRVKVPYASRECNCYDIGEIPEYWELSFEGIEDCGRTEENPYFLDFIDILNDKTFVLAQDTGEWGGCTWRKTDILGPHSLTEVRLIRSCGIDRDGEKVDYTIINVLTPKFYFASFTDLDPNTGGFENIDSELIYSDGIGGFTSSWHECVGNRNKVEGYGGTSFGHPLPLE